MLAAGNVVAGILFGSRKKKKLNKKEEEGVSPTEMKVLAGIIPEGAFF